jgi:hypothetical protein
VSALPSDVDLGRELLTERIRAETAEARLEAVAIERQLWDWPWERDRKELAELRAKVEAQAAELERLRQELRALATLRRVISFEDLVAAIVGAVDRGAEALPGRVVASAQAEVRALLAVDGSSAGVNLREPGDAPPSALSRLTVDVRPVPPPLSAPPVEQTRLAENPAALDDVVRTLLELQTVLSAIPVPPVYGLARSAVYHDAHARIRRELVWSTPAEARAAGRRPCRVCDPRDVPLLRERALAVVAQATAAGSEPPLTLETIAGRLAGVVAAIRDLARVLPAARAPADGLRGTHAALVAEPGAATVAAFALVLRNVLGAVVRATA